jgi:hypothetical protein
MHVIKWVDLEDLEREMNDHGTGFDFYQRSMSTILHLFSEVLKVKAHPSFTEHIIDHINREPVDWNVTAAKKLIRHLSE